VEAENGGRFLVGIKMDTIFSSHDVMVVVLNELMQMIGSCFMDAELFKWNNETGFLGMVGIHVHDE
jgi:hypothetical protein